jgi:hypothetical protein
LPDGKGRAAGARDLEQASTSSRFWDGGGRPRTLSTKKGPYRAGRAADQALPCRACSVVVVTKAREVGPGQGTARCGLIRRRRSAGAGARSPFQHV